MLLVSVDSAYARTDCSGYRDTYPDHYCACNYDHTKIQDLSGLKNLIFNDSIWFKTTLKTFTEAGMTAYLFSESDVQVDIYQNCRSFNKMEQFTVSKNQTRDLDHQTILDKLEQNGASSSANTVIYVLFYPLEEGAECRLMCYPYNTGPNSTAADPLPVLIGMTYVSSHANDVYELKAEAIPTSYALYTQWKEEKNDPCHLKVTRGSANGPVVAEHDFLSAETYFYFDPALLAEVKASGESLYMHYDHDASVAGRIQVIEGKVSEKTIDVTECQGKTYQIDDVVFSQSAVYTTMAWVNATTLEKTTYNIVFTEPEAQYDTLRVNISDLPYSYREQFTIPVSGPCDYDFTIQRAGECDERVLLHVIRMSEEYMTICHGETYTWNGNTYAVSGSYSISLPNANGCEDIATLHLTVLPAVAVTEESATVCHGETYTWQGKTYSVSGDYSLTLSDVNGCDSVVTLHLTVLPEVAVTEENAIVCHGETYTWQGQTYSVSGDYSLTLQDVNGCDSVVTLHLTVLPEAATSETTVVACDSYLWFGTTYTESGDYTYVTTTNQGCEHTAVLHLTINHSVATEETATTCDSYVWNGKTYTESGDYTFTTVSSNGCDSVVTLHLTVWPEVPVTEERATVCHGETYTWNGTSYSVSGDYSLTLSDVHGCDSVVTLHLTVLPEVAVTEERATVCHGETYTWNGTNYSVSGDYSLTLSDVNGCDSVVTLHLTVLPEVAITEERATVCYGETYTWNGTSYSVSGDYSLTLSDVNGCDSVVTLHLTVLPEVPVTEERVTVCHGETYTWQGKTYSVSGDYTVTYADMNGCDSIFVLHLTILPEAATSEETIVACDSYEWHGETYTESGDYTYVTTAVSGCEHTAILHLTINKSEFVEETVSACDSYEWHGITYIESGDYVFETTTAAGCDRIETLHLTIHKSEFVEEIVSACDSYEWHGMTYIESGDYTYTITTVAGCDSVETLHLTIHKSDSVEETVSACDSYEWHGETYTESGDYTYTITNAAGCDSVETLHLTINKSEFVEEAVTACDSYVWHDQTYTESGDYTYLTTTDAGCDRTEILHLTIDVCSAVDDVLVPSSKIYKVLDGERIIIIRDGKSYTLMGQEIL